MASGYFKYHPIEVFIKYFGVCSVNSPVLPDKIAPCEKNVSRETFAIGQDCASQQPCGFPTLFYRGLGHLAVGETILGFTVAGEAPSGYGGTRPTEDDRNRRHHQIPFIS
jgi:hypothetical protein